MGFVRTGTVYDRGSFVEVQGRPTWVVRAGPRGISGPPVVLLHGVPTSAFLYRNVIRALQEEYDVLAFDWYGFGSSAKPRKADYTFRTLRAFLDDFLDAMRLDEVRLVAHDLAGPVALDYAARNPERVHQLALLNTTLYWRDFRPPLPAATQLVPGVRNLARPLFTKPVLAHFFRRAFAHPERLDDRTLDAYWRLLDANDGLHTMWRTWEQLPESLRDVPEIRRRMRRYTNPVLLLVGEKDPHVPPESAHRLAAELPNPRIEILEDAGHFPQEEAAEDVASRLATFFQKGE